MPRAADPNKPRPVQEIAGLTFIDTRRAGGYVTAQPAGDVFVLQPHVIVDGEAKADHALSLTVGQARMLARLLSAYARG